MTGVQTCALPILYVCVCVCVCVTVGEVDDLTLTLSTAGGLWQKHLPQNFTGMCVPPASFRKAGGDGGCGGGGPWGGRLLLVGVSRATGPAWVGVGWRHKLNCISFIFFCMVGLPLITIQKLFICVSGHDLITIP